MAQSCTHMNMIAAVEPETLDTCPECVARGDHWMHLRVCLTCGHVGCCDDSPNRHARAHYLEAGHPIIQSLEPREIWRWCYADEVMLPTARTPFRR
jgi:CPA2 family monovalent cation:H+ antiporter-2